MTTNDAPAPVDNIVEAYKHMAVDGRYRPAAPSDGFGHITVPLDTLDLDAEAAEYAQRWRAEEDDGRFDIGCTDYSLAPATVYAVEAARELCGCGVETARRLLTLALAALEGEEDRP